MGRFDNEVEMKDARYIVMCDFVADNFVTAFKTLEDARIELAERDEPVDAYILEIVERKPAKEE